LFGGTEKNYSLYRIAGVPLVITTWHLPNASLESYRYTNLLKLHISSRYEEKYWHRYIFINIMRK
jgi:hypothetical protein